ncbi:hypothetical protein [Burkholderia cepacia]|uniref:hypothetical protein n=1 Tax=Burkholderia cepacia TaxID=292 RepID=UPI001CF4989C|nr:hypothetical protein [Burkholderia cepacia]MCA8116412.1 hypothetical protein [Burkholderia cepacia]MCA8402454.1 hypothetical protein [Burkholderia cepacia]
MIPAKAHSPSSRIIHAILFAVRRFSVNDGQTRPSRRNGLRAARFWRFSPAFSSGLFNANTSFFLNYPHCLFHSPGNGFDDYKSKLK